MIFFRVSGSMLRAACLARYGAIVPRQSGVRWAYCIQPVEEHVVLRRVQLHLLGLLHLQLAIVYFAVGEADLPQSDAHAKHQGPRSDAQVATWPTADIAASWSNESVLLVVNPELREPLAIDGTRLSNSGLNTIGIAPGVAIAPALSGSPVVNAASGKLVGLLLLDHGQWSIGTP